MCYLFYLTKLLRETESLTKKSMFRELLKRTDNWNHIIFEQIKLEKEKYVKKELKKKWVNITITCCDSKM